MTLYMHKEVDSRKVYISHIEFHQSMIDENIYIYGTFYEILMLVNFIYIASNSKRYIFKRVCTIDFLFSALHTTPFLYAKIYFGVLHLLRARIATSDTTPGSNPT